MRDLKIAYGNSCFAKKWSNKTITFDDLCKRLETTIRTSETVEEYPHLPKKERDRVKDKGGHVGGWLRNGQRKREMVECRSLLTLDGDKVDKDFIDRYQEFNKYASCLYTTHGHTPEAPRVRIVTPLTRDVTPDEYAAITRFFAAEWGIDQFDECSYRPHQLMYWPTTPSNGEYIFERFDGEWLDPDEYLSAHPNWRDCSQLPTSSRESAVIKRELKHQADPLEKDGIIGAFNNAYFPIQDFIESELSDIYEVALGGRYGYIPADSTAGVVIYDDKFAYSNHASDPAYGQLLNAFDLMRVHRYGHLEEKASVKAMLDDAAKDDAVKKWLAARRLEQASDDFSAPSRSGAEWQLSLEVEKSGAVSDTYENYVIIAMNDAILRNVAYNELRDTLDIRGEVPWERIKPGWSKSDEVGLYAYLSHVYGLYSPAKADNAIKYAADRRRFHPIREYLDGLPAWDAASRVETLLVRYLQAEDTLYVRAVTRKTLAAAVARAYKPGTKFDSVLVLDGDQGIGKSTLFKDLVGDEYYTETLTLTDMDDKTGAEKLQGFWAAEIPEFAGMKKADIEKVKAFMSTSDDKYRPSYGKVVESHPRQCILIGTVNGERGYLRDITGNRRFWIVKVHQQEQTKKWSFTDYERDQIWAEAKAIWQSGEKLYLEGDLIKLAEEAQHGAMEVDERQGLVEEYLERLLPVDWDEMDIYKRREYIRDASDPTNAIGSELRETVSNPEIWCECFGRKPDELKPADSYALAAIMVRVKGWEKSGERRQIPFYGRQRVYKRLV
jgi:predicted P-loop ATPase